MFRTGIDGITGLSSQAHKDAAAARSIGPSKVPPERIPGSFLQLYADAGGPDGVF
jgi:hypothetical protein